MLGRLPITPEGGGMLWNGGAGDQLIDPTPLTLLRWGNRYPLPQPVDRCWVVEVLQNKHGARLLGTPMHLDKVAAVQTLTKHWGQKLNCC